GGGVELDRARGVLAEVFRGEVLDEREGAGQVIRRQEGKALLSGQGPEHVVLRDGVHGSQGLAKPAPLALGAGQPLLEDLGRDQAGTDENLTQATEYGHLLAGAGHMREL